MNHSFILAPSPQLHFGASKISILPSIIKMFGKRALLVTGAKSFSASVYYQNLVGQLQNEEIEFEEHSIQNEPSPTMIDSAVQKFFSFPDVVVAIGGGSVLDGGKAISAMLPVNEPVKDYLEGVGTKTNHPGSKIPFIAVPTTAGTGSEATKNAVLSETGKNGYKKSLRHNNFVPNVAIVDPALTVTCSQATTAASGMDAFTQLLESYLSSAANPVTDALAFHGLNAISYSLRKAYDDGTDISARTDMALASFLSGVTLANAGLGLVHGFASSIGGYLSIPHGIICSALMAPVNQVTVRKLRSKKGSESALSKYAAVGKIFASKENKSEVFYTDLLLDTIKTWANEMNIPQLSQCGLKPNDFEKIVSNTENKNNPVNLSAEEMLEVLEMTSF